MRDYILLDANQTGGAFLGVNYTGERGGGGLDNSTEGAGTGVGSTATSTPTANVFTGAAAAAGRRMEGWSTMAALATVVVALLTAMSLV